MPEPNSQPPPAIATATATIEPGSLGLSGWLKMVGNLSAMTIVAAIACWLLYTFINDIKAEIRDLHHKADEHREALKDIQRDLEEIRRDHARQKPWFERTMMEMPKPRE